MDRRWEQKRTEGYVFVFIYYTLPIPHCGIGYNGFLFPHSYSCDDLGAGFFFRMCSIKAVTWVRMRKKKPVISNTGKFVCFNNNVSNLYNNSVVEKINGMAFNPTTTLKLIYWFIYHQSIVYLKKMSSIIYPYVPMNLLYFVNCYSKI